MSRKRRAVITPKQRIGVAAAAAAALVLAGCGSSGSNGGGGKTSGGLTNLRLAYDFPEIDFEAVPFVVGENHGFYKKAGLNVKVILPPDTSTTVKMVSRGLADLGFDTTADVAFARAAGVPITSIGNYSQQNNWGLVTNPGSPVNINDVKGKSFGVFTDAWTKSMMPFILKAGHVSASDVKQIIFTSNDLTPMLAHKIDIATNTTNYAIAAVKSSTGKSPDIALGTKFGAPNVPIWVYTATPSWLKGHAQQAKGFLAATAKATQWAIVHPAQAVKEFDAAYPHNGESAKYNLIGWQATIPFLKDSHGQLLTQTATEWNQIIGALKGAGQISKTFPASTYYSNSYLPK